MAAITDALIKTGNTAIETTGTAVPISTEFGTIYGVVINAPAGNSGPVYLGSAGVTNTAGAAGNGYGLAPGKNVSIPITDLSKLYMNGAAGDYVTFNVLSMFGKTPDPVYNWLTYGGDFVTYGGDQVFIT